MAVSGIGVRQIMPRGGAGWRSANPSPDRASESEADESASKSDETSAEPGTGRIVDKTA